MKINTIRKDIMKNRGITLVALVITIIILIILAGITISTILRENGLIEKSKSGASNYTQEATKEQTVLDSVNAFLEGINTGSTIPAEPYKNPYIPTGFTHVGTEDWNSGYTIKNSTTNDEFVWVPCTLTATSETVTFGKTTTGNYNSNNLGLLPTDTTVEEEDSSVEAIRTSVGTYGGFYIAKYEASKSDNTENAIPRSLPNATPWVSISKTNAIEKSATMVDNSTTGVHSALISGECWDTTLQWIVTTSTNAATNEGYDTDSTNKGHYSQSSATTTASNTAYAVNNIYDMAGNVFDWTTENCKYNGSNKSVMRGGDYYYSSSVTPAADRGYYDDSAADFIGFRTVIYK